MTHYKWIRRKGDKLLPPHGGKGEWPPVGQWLDADGPVDPCEHGLHLCRVRDLASWVRLDLELYEVGVEGAIVEAGDKIVVPRGRLTRLVGVATREILVEWSRGCVRSAIEHATRVLPIFEARYPDDARPRKAIEAAQAFVDASAASAVYAACAASAARYAVYAACAASAASAASAADGELQRQGEDLLRLIGSAK